MKAFYIVSCLLLIAAASAAFVILRPAPKSPPKPEVVEAVVQSADPDLPQEEMESPAKQTNAMAAAVQTPVQPLEERGDALLFEIDALQNTPFDDAVPRPFD